MWTRACVFFGCIALLLCTSTGWAQAGKGYAEALRNQLRAEARQFQEEAARDLEVFFDRSRPADERLAAGQRLALIPSSKLEDANESFRDVNEPDEIRAVALRLIASAGALKGQAIDEVLKIVGRRGDASTDPHETLKVACIRQLQITMFGNGHTPDRIKIVTALEKALDDPSAAVQAAALDVLASRDNPKAVAYLTGTIAPTAGRPRLAISKTQAIGYAAVAQDPTPFYAALRPLLGPDQEADSSVRIAALVALSRDPRSRDTIQGILEDPDETLAAKSAALLCLAKGNSREFVTYVPFVIDDPSQHNAIQAAAIQATDTIFRQSKPGEYTSVLAQPVYESLWAVMMAVKEDSSVRDAARAAVGTMRNVIPGLSEVH